MMESPTDARVESATETRSATGRTRKGDRGGTDGRTSSLPRGSGFNSLGLLPKTSSLLTVLPSLESSLGLSERTVGKC